MVALPATPLVSQPDKVARNKGIFANGAAPTSGAPIEIQISTSTPTNMPPTGYASVWATSAGLQFSADGSTVAPIGRITLTIPYIATSVDDNIFIAPRACKVSSIKSVPTVIASSGPTTLDIKKCTTTDAPSAGTTLFASTTIDLVGVANTVQTPALTATGATLTLATGDRLARDFTGTMTAATGVTTIVIDPA